MRKIVLFVYTERRCEAWVVVMVVADLQTVAVPAVCAVVAWRLAVVRLALVALARPRPKQTQLNRQSTGKKASVLFYWVKGG